MPKQDKPLKFRELRKRLKDHKVVVFETGGSGSHHIELVGYDKSGNQQAYRLPRKDEYDRNYIRAIRDRFGISPAEFYKH